MRGMLNTSTTPSPEKRTIALPNGVVTTVVNEFLPRDLRRSFSVFSSAATLLLCLASAGRGFPDLAGLNNPGAARPDPVLSTKSLTNS
jgi:hypothetical protein